MESDKTQDDCSWEIERLKINITNYVKSHGTDDDLLKIKYAINDIVKHHANQIRKSGQPVIIHPLRVGWLICEAGLDAPTVIAALLHDIIEDTSVTKEYVSQRYGNWYAGIVDGLTKITDPPDSYGKRQQNREKTYNKMLLTMKGDVRVLFIKLFDRLDNMRDLQYMPRHKQRSISRETLEVYVPLAERLGLGKISREHKELCFQMLYPRRYQKLKSFITEMRVLRKESVKDMRSQLFKALEQIKDQCKDIQPMWVHPSVYIDKQEIDRVLDGFKVVVEDKLCAYQALGLLHSNFRVIPLKMRDYISNPRWDGYRSLMTDLIIDGEITGIEIQSVEMEATNEFGIMAYWHGSVQEFSDYYSSYFKQLDDLTEDKDLRMDSVLRLASSESMQIFTPRGDALLIPKGSTVLDFAYHIHSEIGDRCIGALVNSKKNSGNAVLQTKRVPRDRQLFHGESVEILTDPNCKPKPDWLNIVITPKARNHINRTLRDENALRLQRMGRERALKELSAFTNNPEDFLHSAGFTQTLQQENLSIEEFYKQVGNKTIKIHRFVTQHNLVRRKMDAKGMRDRFFPFKPLAAMGKPEYFIEDLNDAFFQFAPCCQPIPGDRIVGTSSDRDNLVVHRNSCSQVQNVKGADLFSVGWKLDDELHAHHIILYGKEEPGALHRITRIISNLGVNIQDSKSEKYEKGALFEFTLEPVTWKTYRKIIEKLRDLKTVNKITNTSFDRF